MARVFRFVLRSLLVLLILIVVSGAFWFGLVPQRLSPFPPLSLTESAPWFADARLAALRFDPAQCRAILTPPHIEAVPIPDNPIKKGCGWVNSVQVAKAGGAEIGVSKLTCEMAAALALWLEHDVQPLAEELLGARVASVHDMGTYDCRNIVGNPFWKDLRSQHATANAYDIGGFTLTDGRRITVLANWKGPEKEAEFLHAIHRRACRWFRVVLGPEANAAHRNHFHFDRGFLWACR